ncbi:MAG: hydrolase 1, exosortase A system-associated [Betaproteobacteria bacterium]
MKFTERALTFACDSLERVGVLAEPENPAPVGVLVIVGGPQYRAGSHRQFVLLGRALAAAGFPAMRFDSRGMGDSEGDALTFEESDADIAAAIERLLAECPGIDRVVLWGLCDAASAALMYCHARRDARVAGLVLLNPWVRSEASFAKTHIKHYYGKRLLDKAFWGKLFGGGVDIGRSLRDVVAAAARVATRSGRRGDGVTVAFQRRMALGLESFPGQVLLVLSGRDLTASEFLEYTQGDAMWRAALQRPNIRRHDIPDADHTFSSAPWSREVEVATLGLLVATDMAARR